MFLLRKFFHRIHEVQGFSILSHLMILALGLLPISMGYLAKENMLLTSVFFAECMLFFCRSDPIDRLLLAKSTALVLCAGSKTHATGTKLTTWFKPWQANQTKIRSLELWHGHPVANHSAIVIEATEGFLVPVELYRVFPGKLSLTSQSSSDPCKNIIALG